MSYVSTSLVYLQVVSQCMYTSSNGILAPIQEESLGSEKERRALT